MATLFIRASYIECRGSETGENLLIRNLKKELQDLEYASQKESLGKDKKTEIANRIVVLIGLIAEKEREFEVAGKDREEDIRVKTTSNTGPTRYLLLDFIRKDSGSDRFDDYYNKALKDQYNSLAIRHSLRAGYENLIQTCFPVGEERSYYVSMPDIIREDAENEEKKFINNVVIRSKRGGASNFVLPLGKELILIGDLKKDDGQFTVKGIEFIDGSIYKQGEHKITATAACAFKFRTGTKFPDYGLNKWIEPDISVFNRDTILSMCKTCYTIPDPPEAIDLYNRWNEYIDFRKYYLEQLGAKDIPFDGCEAVKCFVVSRSDYKKDQERYDDHILDDLDQMRGDEQVIVTKSFENNEPFDLVRVILDKNKKELFSNVTKEKNFPIFELNLRRFTKQAVSLVSEDGKYEVSVDERYRLFFKDIEPDYKEIEEKYSKDLEKKTDEVDRKYASVVDQEIREYVKKRTAELEKKDEEALSSYEKKLADCLLKDVADNKDETIRKEYAKRVKELEESEKKQASIIQNQLNKKIATVKTDNKKPEDEDVAVLVKKIEDELSSALEDLKEKMTHLKDAILPQLYDKRNKNLAMQKETNLGREREATLAHIKVDKRREIEGEQASNIQKEKADAKRLNKEELEKLKAEMKGNQTIRRYYIYFKLKPNYTPESVNSDISKYKPKVFKLDLRGDKFKIERQEKSLNSFFNGYVRNPFLSSYLFAPEKLDNIHTELPEIDYCSVRLNEKQKEAVKKAVASESLFLLQGPPGTGKTEVIAEVAAQFVKLGKRVLISSETHKAIDNVFDRLPLIPEIRPLRLIPSQSKTNKEAGRYSPERLVDNFYRNISDRLHKDVKRFKKFGEYKEKFDEEYKSLKLDLEKLNREKKSIEGVEIQLERTKRERSTLSDKCDIESEKLRILEDEYETLSYRLRNIEALKLTTDDSVSAEIQNVLKKYPIIRYDMLTPSLILKADIKKIEEEIASLSDNSEIVKMDSERKKIKKQMDALRDENTDDIIAGKGEEYSVLQKQFIDIGNKIKKTNTTNIDLSELLVWKLVNEGELNNDVLKSLADMIIDIKKDLIELIGKKRDEIGREIDNKKKLYNKQKTVTDELKGQIRNKDEEEVNAKANADYEEYRERESIFKRKISEFLTTFNIEGPYNGMSEALEIIRRSWNDLEKNYKDREKENRDKIPMYERILKFLKGLQDDKSIETDRIEYTKKLFDNANVIGLTATSRSKFNEKSMESFKTYALGDLDIKRMGIDVVIVDEVSKSSFLDLLIPILYGKTVILVGDHRQLPPMYDLRNMRKDDFIGLDEGIINESKNKEYTKLYEECIFKTLFEKVPERFKVTLTKQYRSHEDIMRVFNHFYCDARGKGSLELGQPNQNDKKEHGLLVKNKLGKPIIQTNKHIYFVDCNDSPEGYENFGDGTSATNKREADVIIELAKKIDEAYGSLAQKSMVGVEEDERMSMGVICTYGDQANQINKKLRRSTFKNICEKEDERFIVSTVDDFQGDERDIIFVSMVGNPRPEAIKYRKADFLKKYERINVALSRARRMLVIVGSKDFLSDVKIDLPDMNGDSKLDNNAYPVYKEIIDTIATYGSLLTAGEVLGEDR